MTAVLSILHNHEITPHIPPHATAFQVLSADGDVQVGKISKQWSGLVKEAFTDTDNFGITFPLDLDVKMKATLLGAIFLIVSTTDDQKTFLLFYFFCQSVNQSIAPIPRSL